MSLTIQLAGEELILLPERGLFWARESMLLVADWHIGKAATFRASGIGVPEGGLEEEFARVESMVAATGAGSMIILGDFVHARDGLTAHLMGEVGSRMADLALPIGLVSGNHDRSAGINRVSELGLEMLGTKAAFPPFLLRHEPGKNDGSYVLAGHIHPALWFGEGKRGGVRAPCFWFGAHCGVLPAFGDFTGGRRIDRRAGDRVFAVGDGEVIKVY